MDGLKGGGCVSEKGWDVSPMIWAVGGGASAQ